MAALDTAAALITLAALFSWANHRFIRLPSTIALLLGGAVLLIVRRRRAQV